VIAIVFLVALRSRTADFNGDWLLEDLTCEELVEAYGFELVVLDQLVDTYTGCLEYSNSPADAGFGRLHCELLRKEGEFVKGVANDIANVYNAKLECTNP
jgi:hypothetical protein